MNSRNVFLLQQIHSKFLQHNIVIEQQQGVSSDTASIAFFWGTEKQFEKHYAYNPQSWQRILSRNRC